MLTGCLAGPAQTVVVTTTETEVSLTALNMMICRKARTAVSGQHKQRADPT